MPEPKLDVRSATRLPPGIVRQRKPCPYCGRMIKPQYAAGYAQRPHRHKCPHGRWCSASKSTFWREGDDRCPLCAAEREREVQEEATA